MTQQELKHILSSRFDFEKWKDLLGMMFLKIDYLSKPIQIDADLVKSGGQVGTIRLDDGRSLGLFMFEVADNIQIARNRKGLRDIAIKYVDQDIIHGALVFYYSENHPDYRLTFISKQTSLNEDGSFETKTTAPKRYTFLLGTNEPCTTGANRLQELINKKKSGSVYLADVMEAFSVERLNKDFFKGYKEQYFKFLDLIGKESKENRDYVKKLLGRLVFLQFLQKKGWMGVPASHTNWEGGDKNYLYNLVKKYNGNDRLLSDVLEVLFFNTLNEKRTNDMSNPILGDNIKIPYLNGGLFDKDDLDKKDIDFPYPYFEELMEFFGMYNFTIDENDPDDAEVGVDPEMLGHIFENLLEDNKDKGAFYTPKEIVQYMSEESIAQYLKTHAEEALHPAIEELIKQKKVDEALQNKATASAVYKLLCDVKVCDPAIGSGAFPMGVLNVLYHSRLLLYGFTKPIHEFSPANVKREIIQNNIYGVDIEQGAVDIARLRFWLALVVDETQPEPLPNLDFKIMQGNSLLEEFDGIDLSSLQNQVMQTTVYEPQRDLFGNVEDSQMKMTFTQKETVDNLQANLEKYFNIDDHTQKQAVKEEISNSVKDHISYNIELRKDQCLCLIQEANEAISDEESKIEDIKTRFPEDKMPVGEIRKHEKKISDLKKVIDRNNKKVHHYDSVSRELETIDLTSNESFFLWHTWFKDVFDNGGFDVVIGNPPYGVSIKGDYREEIVRYLGKVPDYEIYYYFIQIAAILLLENGILSYIIPNTYLFNNYAKNYRIGILERWNVIEILDCTKFKIFESATVFNTINTWRKTINGTHRCIGYRKTTGIDSFKSLIDSPQLHMEKEDLLKMNQNWGLAFSLDNKAVGIINKVSLSSKTIENYFPEISQGLIAYDKYRGQPDEIIRSRAYHFNEYRIGLKKWLWGEDVKRYVLSWNGQEYIDYCSGIANPRQPKFFKGKRLLVREITNPSIFATITCDELYNDPSIIIVKDNDLYPLEVVLAILNSKLATFYHFNHSPKATKGAFPKILVQDIKDFPLPDVPDEQRELIINHVDRILSTKKEDSEADTSAWEEEIDGLVYGLYGLNDEEINIVKRQ